MVHKPATESPCDFQCVPKTKEETERLDEFVGPVRIRLMKTSRLYTAYKIWFSTLLSLANGLLLANYVFVCFYVSSFKLHIYNNCHVFFCTTGYQLLLFSGIYITNANFGPAIPLSKKERVQQHIASQIVGCIVGFVGTMMLVKIHSTAQFFQSWHAFFGLLTFMITIGSVIFGSLTSCFKKSIWLLWTFKVVHIVLAAGFIVCSSVCFVTGIQQNSFAIWASFMYVSGLNIMMCFCAVYMGVAFLSCFLNVYAEIAHK